MKILAIDPGITTGIAVGDISADVKCFPSQVEMIRGFYPAACFLHEFMYNSVPDLIVIERFTITQKTARLSQEGSRTTIELIGVIRYLAERFALRLETQSPNEAKEFITDEKLKRVGWWVPGPDHARDALRHLLLAAFREQMIDGKELLPAT